jgi:hypothetical protein
MARSQPPSGRDLSKIRTKSEGEIRIVNSAEMTALRISRMKDVALARKSPSGPKGRVLGFKLKCEEIDLQIVHPQKLVFAKNYSRNQMMRNGTTSKPQLLL